MGFMAIYDSWMLDLFACVDKLMKHATFHVYRTRGKKIMYKNGPHCSTPAQAN